MEASHVPNHIETDSLASAVEAQMMRRVRCALIGVTVLLCGCASHHPTVQRQPSKPSREADLLFTAGPMGSDGSRELWVMDRSGAHRRSVTRGLRARGAWGADGQSVVYVDPQGTLTVVDTESGNSRSMALKGRRVSLGQCLRDTQRFGLIWDEGTGIGRHEGMSLLDLSTGRAHQVAEWEPPDAVHFDISPDDTWAAVVRAGAGVARVDLSWRDAGKVRVVIPETRNGFWRSVFFSPDGRYLAGYVWRTGSMTAAIAGEERKGIAKSLWLCDGKTGDLVCVYGPVTTMSGIAWHPTLKKLAFATLDVQSAQSRLWFATLRDGKWDVSQVASLRGVVSLAGWSSDGTAFAYALATSGERSRIYVADANGQEAHPISPADACDGEPRWRPVPVRAGGR